MDEELLRLQQELAEVQLEDSEQRLSDKNVVTLILKLIQLKKVELVYTLTGKEYLTPTQLENEIEDEITSRGGRLRLDEISASLNIDIIDVENAVKNLVGKNEEISYLGSIEVITSWYLDTAAMEWNELLQEKGQITIGEIATKYSLPVDVVSDSVNKRLESGIIKAALSGSVLYTDAFVEQQRAKIRGILLGSTQPLSLSKLCTTYDLDSNMSEKLIKEMLNEGEIPGRLVTGEYVPFVFTVIQRTAVDAFFKSNGYIDLDMLKKLKIKGGHKFVCESFKDAVLLDSCIVSGNLLHSVEAAVDECVVNETVFEIRSIILPQLTEKDCNALLYKVPALKSRKNPTAKVFSGRFVVSNSYIEKIEVLLKGLASEAGKLAAKSRPAKGTISPKPIQKPLPDRAAEKPTKKKGKKGKSRRRRGDSSDGEFSENQTSEKASVDSHLVESLDAFLKVSTISKNLENENESLKSNGQVNHDVILESISKARSWFTESYTETLTNLHRGGEAKRRAMQVNLEKEFETFYPSFQMFSTGLSKIEIQFKDQPEHVVIAELQESYLQSVGFNLIGILLEYQCSNLDMDFAPEKSEENVVKKLRNDVDHCRNMVSGLPQIIQKKFKALYAFLLKDGLQFSEFLPLIEKVATEICGFLLPKIDKKLERNMLFGHRQMLLSELKISKIKNKVLSNAILLVLLQACGCALPVPMEEDDMTRVARLVPLLKGLLSEDRYMHYVNAAKPDVQDNDAVFDVIRETAEAKDPSSLT